MNRATNGRPIRLLAVNASMTGGGAERQLILLLRHLDRARFAPTLCLLEETGPLLAEVPSDVPVDGLDKRSRFDLPRLVKRLARILRRDTPDVVFSKVDYTNTVVALAGALSRADVPLVMSETSVQSRALRDMSFPWVRRTLLRWSYTQAACIVVPSPGVETDLRSTVGVTNDCLHVIQNMVDIAGIRTAARERVDLPFADGPTPLLVAAGRLHPAKGYDDLLLALRLLKGTRACNLAILGVGPEQARLEKLVVKLGISEHVAFMGFRENPFAVMARADVFVSASHFESFGNTLIEAMTLGVPVVTTRVPAGPEWIVTDNETGIFADPSSPADLAAKIELVLDNGDLRARLGVRASEEAQRYDVHIVIPAYERVLHEAATRQLA